LQAHCSAANRSSLLGALPAFIPESKPSSLGQRRNPIVAAIAREIRHFNQELEALRGDHNKVEELPKERIRHLHAQREALMVAEQTEGTGRMRLWLPAIRSPKVGLILDPRQKFQPSPEDGS
jgi:hypothetical protein